MDAAEFLFVTIGVIMLGAGNYVYASNPKHHKCNFCGKILTVKMHRYWWVVDGEYIAACSNCKKQYDQVRNNLRHFLSEDEFALVEININGEKTNLSTQSKDIAEKIDNEFNSVIRVTLFIE